jgi:Zn finger protein HypA/HybF involved in hydrogenase expression
MLNDRKCIECEYLEEDRIEGRLEGETTRLECPKCHSFSFIRLQTSSNFKISGNCYKNGWN